MEERVKFFVRHHVGGRWSFGSKDRAFLYFESKGAAVARGKVLVSKIEYAALVVEEPAVNNHPEGRHRSKSSCRPSACE
jgi:hypothetical protein